MNQPSIRADHEGGPLHTCDGLAVHGLLLDQIEAIHDGLIRIGQQRVRQIVLLLKLLLRFDGVARDSQHHNAGLL